MAFSGKAIVAKLLYRHGVDALSAVALRMLLAGPLFLLMAWWSGRGQAALTRRDWAQVALLGFMGYYLSSLLDFAGLQYISASLERLILYVYPTIVVLIMAVRRRSAISRRQALALAASYAGLLLAFGQESSGGLQAPAAQVAWGSALVLASAVSYAVYLVLAGDAVARLGALRVTGLASSFACALCLVHFCLLRPSSAWYDFAPEVWQLSVLNATLCTVLPIWMVMRAIESIGSSDTAQLALIGPVTTLLLAVWLLQEPFTLTLLAGTALVLFGVAILAGQKQRAAP